VFALLWGMMAGQAFAAPAEPPVDQVVGVETHVSLGVIFTYADGSRFVHSKKGAVEYVKPGPERLEIRAELGEVWYTTVDGALYTLWLEPVFYYEPVAGRYESMIEKTWHSCGCR